MDAFEAPEEAPLAWQGITAIVFGVFGLGLTFCCPLGGGILGACAAMPFPLVALGLGFMARDEQGSLTPAGMGGIGLGAAALVLDMIMCVVGGAIGAAIGMNGGGF